MLLQNLQKIAFKKNFFHIQNLEDYFLKSTYHYLGTRKVITIAKKSCPSPHFVLAPVFFTYVAFVKHGAHLS